MNVRTNVLEGLKIQTSLDTICLSSKTGSISITPAEADIFTSLVGMAKSMEGMKNLAPYIQSSPFRATFDRKVVILTRLGQKDNGLKINFSEVDKVIRATRFGVEMYRDAQIHRGETSPVMGAVSGEIHDPEFDGLV